MKIKQMVNIMLISILSISCWEIGKKQVSYIDSTITYNKVQKQIEKVEDKQEYLYNQSFDWIEVTETSINYPLMSAEDNAYYLYHNHLHENDNSGAIFYDSLDTEYNGLITIIFGHSMKNGTMFNNLHYFQKDQERFINSRLVINDEEKETIYKPVGYAVYNSTDPFYRKVDNMNVEEGLDVIKAYSDYFIEDVDYHENSHIMALVTCDYSIDNGRFVVFYISE